MGHPKKSGLFLEIRLWRDGPASRKSPHVRFSSATNISHRIVTGEVCLFRRIAIPPFRKVRERMGHPDFFTYLGIGSQSQRNEL
jgi:hypothetical protein